MIRFATAAIALAMTGAAVAQTPAVDVARSGGLIGERFDGYVGIVRPVTPAVRSEVAKINNERRALYSRLAAAKGASPSDVGVTAGCQLLARVPVGGAYMWNDGGWRTRGPKDPPPVPFYCS